jgi:hypothetical protein
MTQRWIAAREDVEPDRPFEVSHVEVANLLGAPPGHIGEQCLGIVA